jgi:outer membrane usher protein
MVALGLSLLSGSEADARLVAGPDEQLLQLEVLINEERIGLIGSFLRLSNGRIAALGSELQDIGVKVPTPAEVDAPIVLDTLSGVSYRYDEPAQTISIHLPDGRRMPHVYDAAGASGATLAARSDLGGAVDYSLFAAQSLELEEQDLVFSGASATIDARIFGPLGVFSQTGIVGTTTSEDFDALRLDTTFFYSDPQSVMTYVIGDAISGGLGWTRPIRFGGMQARRNFTLRSDLVTAPLPSFSGSAAVPSTLDVYVQNVSVYSQSVPTGPFEITNLPALFGQDARIVLSDAAGRETEVLLPAYGHPDLLREDLADFSIEAGFPRMNYATESFDYVGQPFAAASLRYGITNRLTAQAHAEADGDLFNGGVGAVTSAGALGVLSVAASGSERRGKAGLQLFAAYDTALAGISLNLSTQRAVGDYLDLAAASAESVDCAGPADDSICWSAKPPRALDRISISTPVPYDVSSLTLSFVNYEPQSGASSKILTASWTRPVLADAQLYVTGFSDFGDDRNIGMFAGVSMPLGRFGSGSSAISTGSDGIRVTTDLIKPMSGEIGSYGWRLRDSEGEGASRLAAVSYRSPFAAVEAGLEHAKGQARGFALADGAIAMMAGDIFFANRIEDSFAIVDAGAPDVEVFHENRLVGKTDASGLLLVPGLRSYASNKISIDAKELPVNVDLGETQASIVPADRSGQVVRFDVKTHNDAAVVILVDGAGAPLPAGSILKLGGFDTEFIVGYDGRVYLTGLKAENTIVVAAEGGDYRGTFAFTPAGERQVVIGPVVCQ